MANQPSSGAIQGNVKLVSEREAVFFEKVSFLPLCRLMPGFAHFLIGLFVFWMLRCVSSLYILDVNPLWDKAFTDIFSHTVGCLIVLLMVSFAVQKFFSLMQSHLFIFAFVSLA